MKWNGENVSNKQRPRANCGFCGCFLYYGVMSRRGFNKFPRRGMQRRSVLCVRRFQSNILLVATFKSKLGCLHTGSFMRNNRSVMAFERNVGLLAHQMALAAVINRLKQRSKYLLKVITLTMFSSLQNYNHLRFRRNQKTQLLKIDERWILITVNEVFCLNFKHHNFIALLVVSLTHYQTGFTSYHLVHSYQAKLTVQCSSCLNQVDICFCETEFGFIMTVSLLTA